MEKTISLYNTLSRSVEKFVPIDSHVVGIYSCGPTVYHYAHIGNLRAYVFADTLRRTLAHKGYIVKHVINITDVGHLVSDGDDGEDKLEKGAAREGKSVFDVADFYTKAFMKDLEAIYIPKEKYFFPKATETIQEQIDLVIQLEKKGYTYTISDGVYFDTSKFKEYPDLAKLDIQGLDHGARVEENKEKRNRTDFALWKFSPKDTKRQMEWDSPWGIGFPGWHIECSAMSKKLLGTHFDIHTGGVDHIPVHHTNEIAQSTCASGETYVNYWMHVNFLHDTTGKMSKSNDDFLTLDTLIQKGYSPLAYRYFLLTAHYRKELTFSYEALDAASVAYKKLHDFMYNNTGSEESPDGTYVSLIEDALFDDINTPEAIAVVWKMMKDDSLSLTKKHATLLAASTLLGLGLEMITPKAPIRIPLEVQTLLDEREQARFLKDFKGADTLREKIASFGFKVKDTATGQEVEELPKN